MNQKFKVIILVVLMLLSTMLVGCGNPEETIEPTSPPRGEGSGNPAHDPHNPNLPEPPRNPDGSLG